MTIDQILIEKIENFELFRLSEFTQLAENQLEVDVIKGILRCAKEAEKISEIKMEHDVLYAPFVNVKNFIKKRVDN